MSLNRTVADKLTMGSVICEAVYLTCYHAPPQRCHFNRIGCLLCNFANWTRRGKEPGENRRNEIATENWDH